MKKSLSTSLIQMNSQDDLDKNLSTALTLCKEALKNKPRLITLPEMFPMRGNIFKMRQSKEPIPGPILAPFMDFAKQHDVYILAGSIYEHFDGKKGYNSSALINSKGEIETVYRKLHLFDMDIEESGVRESHFYVRGDAPKIAEIDGIKVGLSICYDLRFPELYRYYSENGVKIIFAPSSFTRPTGENHWEVLCRARAIENQCFVVAPNQIGIGAGGIETYGNSLAVSPWGHILARGSEDKEEVLTVNLDFAELDDFRGRLPCLKHRVM